MTAATISRWTARACLLVAAIAGLGLFSAASSARAADDPTIPPRIRVGEGNKPFLLAHAVGAQIYSCSSTPAGPKWLVAPRADLYGDNGSLIGTHFAGPTWQARDGSYVKAARVDGVTVDETAIPWLLLKATVKAAGPEGERLANTTYIQRINTVGGLQPADAECNADAVGAVREIAYTADYRFWKEQA